MDWFINESGEWGCHSSDQCMAVGDTAWKTVEWTGFEAARYSLFRLIFAVHGTAKRTASASRILRQIASTTGRGGDGGLTHQNANLTRPTASAALTSQRYKVAT
jgi:hypothetical protein